MAGHDLTERPEADREGFTSGSEARRLTSMTERELFEAVIAMLPNVVNIIGFHALDETEDYEPTPISRIQHECYIAAGGYALARQVYELSERLSAEGIDP